MKVLDLACARLHTFEGWFSSEDDFQNQLARSLVACPVCNDTQIVKRLSAPRLNFGAQPGDATALSSADAGAPSVPVATDGHPAHADWLIRMRELLDKTEDVGGRFAEVARQMHYGETAGRSIRGQTTLQEAVELIDEGIEVLPLAVPHALKGSLQ